MLKRPRRRAADEARLDPRGTPLATAAAVELRGGWPSWRGSLDFWARPEVPAELRQAAAPDPRVVLDSNPETYRQHVAEAAAFEAARRAWLEAVAGPPPSEETSS